MLLEMTLLQSRAEWLYIDSLTWQQTNWTEPLQVEENRKKEVQINFYSSQEHNKYLNLQVKTDIFLFFHSG